MDSKTLFTKIPVLKLFFIASVPGAVSMLASALYQLIDGILVGQVLGDTPFAALNLAMPFVIINFSLADLIGVGSAVPISISLGRKEEKEADNYFTCACLMIVAAGVLIGAVLFLLAVPLLKLMGAEGELLKLSVQYLRVYALCAPVTTIIFAVDNYLRICGKIRASMLLNIFMSLLTAVLEFVFLYIFRWGIWGAGLATCSGMFICTLIAFYPFFRG
ncbi:MAG TPA: MATE family efflux transporter, partial [Candidatus Blautia intestinipullorum]|nr:MATE family efflux transporter [Candidatus Blautia intestinipullorum]